MSLELRNGYWLAHDESPDAEPDVAHIVAFEVIVRRTDKALRTPVMFCPECRTILRRCEPYLVQVTCPRCETRTEVWVRQGAVAEMEIGWVENREAADRGYLNDDGVEDLRDGL